MPRNEKRAYSIREAAQLLSLKQAELEWLISTGQLKEIFLAGRRLVASADIDELLDDYQSVQSRASVGKSQPKPESAARLRDNPEEQPKKVRVSGERAKRRPRKPR